MDEAVIDFKVRRKITPPAIAASDKVEPAPSPKLEVLVAAVKAEVVEAWRQTAEMAGLKLSALGLFAVRECEVRRGLPCRGRE